MPIKDFDFPSVQLTQVFKSTPTPSTSELGVVCVGPALNSIVLEGRLDDNNCVEWGIAGLKATSITSATATTETQTTDISDYTRLVIIDKDTDEITDVTDDTDTKKATHIQVVIPETAGFVLADTDTVKITCEATHVSRYGVVDALGDVEAELGPLSAENKLAVAVYSALSESDGNTVSYYIVDDTHDYKQAIGVLDNKQNLYSVVITSSEIDDIKACITAIEDTAKDKYSKVRRTLWYGIDIEDATTATDAVEELITARKKRTHSYRAQCVFGEGVIIDGYEVGSYALAAAAAGMRSYEPCHRPLSNLPYTEVTLKETLGFTRQNLLDLGAEGIWLVRNKNGVATNLRQVTTCANDDNLNHIEESIVANADEIAMSLANIGEDKVGCSNITNQLLLALADDITLAMDKRLLNTTGSAYIGPQLISWSLDKLEQDTTALDRVTAVITCTPPKPFNTFVMQLVII